MIGAHSTVSIIKKKWVIMKNTIRHPIKYNCADTSHGNEIFSYSSVDAH